MRLKNDSREQSENETKNSEITLKNIKLFLHIETTLQIPLCVLQYY